MSLPIFKLGALLAKQISKPLSKILKEKATRNPKLKNYLIIPFANVYHNIDITLRMRILGLGSPDKVPPLTEKAAVELGGDILAEFFVFGTALGAILAEYYRQASKTSFKEQSMADRVRNLENDKKELIEMNEATNKRIQEINQFLVDQKAKIEDLNSKINVLDTRKGIKRASQETQTSNGIVVGKVMHPKGSYKQASGDVTNSTVYQSADKAVNLMKGSNGKKNEQKSA